MWNSPLPAPAVEPDTLSTRLMWKRPLSSPPAAAAGAAEDAAEDAASPPAAVAAEYEIAATLASWSVYVCTVV